MPQAAFVFHPDLDTLLRRGRGQPALTLSFPDGQSIKHLVESLGIPHTEVGEVWVNGLPTHLDSTAPGGTRVEIFPVKEGASPTQMPRFILDTHLGKLAHALRLLGFDSLYFNDVDDPDLAERAANEGRILLSRDRGLLMRKQVVQGCLVRSSNPQVQLLQVLRRYDLRSCATPFTRCVNCNGMLQYVSKDDVLDQLEPLTRRYFDEFHRCEACGQVYWRGSHQQKLINWLEGLPPA